MVWLNYIQIAIDGPAGAGKSTIAKLIADKLNYTHIDTGSMYRAITLKAIILNIDLADENSYGFVDDTTFKFINNEIYMDGKNVSSEIRGNDVSNNVSLVSSHLYVRERLVKAQYDMAQNFNIVMDGRDIGTVVFPDAELKLFVTSDTEIRAKRRYNELRGKGEKVSLEDVKANLEKRDYIDSHRKESPLTQAEDAVIIDTSHLTREEQTDVAYELVMGRVLP